MLEFYRCYNCKKPMEIDNMLAKHKCVCGSVRFAPAFLPIFPLVWYLIRHPKTIAKIFRKNDGD